MTQTRIVLPQKHKPFAEELLQVTGIDSLSNLFVVFLTRYGHHLKASWNISQPGLGQYLPTAPTTSPAAEVSVIQSQIQNQQKEIISEPLSELEPEIDPVIERIAMFVDRF
jgi:hypothetical protein